MPAVVLRCRNQDQIHSYVRHRSDPLLAPIVLFVSSIETLRQCDVRLNVHANTECGGTSTAYLFDPLVFSTRVTVFM